MRDHPRPRHRRMPGTQFRHAPDRDRRMRRHRRGVGGQISVRAHLSAGEPARTRHDAQLV